MDRAAPGATVPDSCVPAGDRGGDGITCGNSCIKSRRWREPGTVLLMEGRLQTGVVERVSNDPGLSSDNPARSVTVIKVNANRLRDLLLRIAEILAPRGDAR